MRLEICSTRLIRKAKCIPAVASCDVLLAPLDKLVDLRIEPVARAPLFAICNSWPFISAPAIELPVRISSCSATTKIIQNESFMFQSPRMKKEEWTNFDVRCDGPHRLVNVNQCQNRNVPHFGRHLNVSASWNENMKTSFPSRRRLLI